MSQLLSELQMRGELREHALGQVFYATDRLGKARYLVKRLSIGPVVSPRSAQDLAARFAEDANRLAALPPSLRFACVCSTPEDHAANTVVLEQPAGPSLAAFFEHHPASTAALLGVAADIVDILLTLETAGIRRINLIPGSFFIGPDGRTQYLDLEFAPYEAFERAFPGRLWPEDCRFLTPEQLAGHEGGPASQVFSLGMLLHLFARGRTPFDAPSPQAVRNLLLNSEAASIRPDRDDLPPEFADAIDLAVCRHPEGRPQSLKEFRAAAGLDKAKRASAPLVTMERDHGQVPKEGIWDVVRRLTSPGEGSETSSLGPPPWLGKVAVGAAVGVLALIVVLFFWLRK